jgi:hypothetical protein
MAYSIAQSPGGLLFAPCLLTLGQQIAASPRYGPFVTNLGQASDAAHRAEGSDSDHNPWLYNMVRAMDLGGPLDLLYELRGVINQMFGARDPRIYPGGYTNGPDRLGTDWENPGALHVMGGDDTGHLHISAPRSLAGCNDTTPWPIPGAGTSGLGGGIAVPAPVSTDWFDMATLQELATVVLSITKSPEMLAVYHDQAYAAVQQFAASQEGHDREVIADREAIATSDQSALIAKIVAAIPSGSGLTEDQIKAAVKAALTEGTG